MSVSQSYIPPSGGVSDDFDIVTVNTQTVNGTTMQLAPELVANYSEGLWRVEILPLFSVDNSSNGVGFIMSPGTAVIAAGTSYMAWYGATPTAGSFRHYGFLNVNHATPNVSRQNNNRARIFCEFRVATAGDIGVLFRSEDPGGSVTLLPDSILMARKMA